MMRRQQSHRCLGCLHPAARSCWTSSRVEFVVPSFAGKSVRAAIELAEQSGLDLDAVGSGVAQEQSPSAGARVTSGSRVTVRFGR